VVAPLIRSARPRPGIPGPLVRHLPALDGLRAVAVIAVIAYHAELGWAPGGFLGVELFFVVSGFLITSLLLAEVEARGTIDLRDFWLRRARRLLPALGLLLAGVAIAGRVFAPENVASTRSGLLGAVTYVTNWQLIWSDVSYFEAIGRPPLLQHLWSLAVEEQYYLLWPLIVAGLVALGGRRAVTAACALGALASTALMWAIVDPNSPSRVYYGTDTRAGGLLLGGLLATTMVAVERPRPNRRARSAIELAGVAALGILVWLMVHTSEFDTSLYRGGFLRFAALTAVVILAITVPGSRLARLLSARWLRWIGLRSYGLYLWHWPVFVLTRPHIDVPLSGTPLLVMRLAITVALTEVSYRWVEEPVRTGRFRVRLTELVRFPRPRTHPMTTSAFAAIAVIAAVIISVSGVATSSSAQAWDPVPVDDVPAVSSPFSPTTWRLPSTTATTSTTVDPEHAEVPEVDTGEPAPAVEPPPTSEPAPPPPDPAAPPPAPSVEPQRWVHAIGDSVLLASRDALAATLGDGARIDAVVGRQPWDGVPLVQAWAATHPGEHLVVVLGSNGILRHEHVDEIMAAAGPDRRVVFVTVSVPRRWAEPTNDAIRGRVPAYPNARIVDWQAMVAGNGGFVGSDQIHPTRAGALALSAAIRDALG
jgi:peptidoglycan/LPS O-acetylase OafA/YrhL